VRVDKDGTYLITSTVDIGPYQENGALESTKTFEYSTAVADAASEN
jgi:hypothetical protein